MKESLQIKASSLLHYVKESHVLYAQCVVTRKELHLTFYGSFQIWHKNQMVKELDNIFDAVEFFNSYKSLEQQ